MEEQTKGQRLINSLITKTWEDEIFKKKLIANPQKEIENIIGKPLPGDKKVFVIDQSNSDHIYINIPVKPALDNLELNEDQLEKVAGGTSILDPIIDTVKDWLEDYLK